MNNPERIAAFLGIAILASACADQNTPVVSPEQSKATATATATSEIDFPGLSAEQMAKILWRIQDAKDVMNASISKDFGPAVVDFTTAEEVKFWARTSSNSDPHRPQFFARAGPDGILRFRIMNTYGGDGKLLESSITTDIITKGTIEYILKIGRYERSMKHDSPGRIPPENLREVADNIFNLPRNLEWKATISNYEAGTNVPTLKGTGKATDGSDIVFSIDSFGITSLTRTNPSPNLSFEQRFHPHRFAKNGSLKPQFAPRKLGF